MAWDDNLDKDSAAYKLASSQNEVIRAVAGPGSGKSFAIKRRISRLLEEGVNPENILAITFTRTAAQDLKSEIQSLGIKGAELVHARTVHSHALKILMDEQVFEATRRTPRMVIDHEIEPALHDIQNDEYGGIRNLKILLSLYLASWASLQHDDPSGNVEPKELNFQKDIIDWMKSHKGIHVGEVIPVVIDYLRNNPASDKIGAYHTILVDEYQDLNKSEQEFIRLLKGESNVVIVGDDDQSIYGFKYAHPEGIQEVETMFGEYDSIEFDVCRRCPCQVTLMASELINKNTNRTLGDLLPHEPNASGIVNIIQHTTYDDEISNIADIVENELNTGLINPADVLILAPRRRIGYRIRNRLEAKDIPVKSYFREAVITNDFVRYAYSLFNFLLNHDDMISLRYLLGHNSSNYRTIQYKKIKNYSVENKKSISIILDELVDKKISISGTSHIVKQYQKIKEDIKLLSEYLKEDLENGMMNFLRHISGFDEEQVEEHFYEFLAEYNLAYSKVLIDQSETDDSMEPIRELFPYLQENLATPSIPDSIDHVRIMSLHASKGLSAKFVIVCSMIDELIPFIRTDDEAEIEKTVEEQRRLLYVAITRCKASDEYKGRLLISSFLKIDGVDALQMGIPARASEIRRVRSTRYLRDFIDSAPKPEKA